eukprot:1394583-Pleurochrysis_carterae.AAC.1
MRMRKCEADYACRYERTMLTNVCRDARGVDLGVACTWTCDDYRGATTYCYLATHSELGHITKFGSTAENSSWSHQYVNTPASSIWLHTAPFEPPPHTTPSKLRLTRLCSCFPSTCGDD